MTARPVRLALALACVCASLACVHVHDRQATAANDVAVLANDALPPLVGAYLREQEAAIDKAANRAEATAGVQSVRARWARVWSAWDALRAAHDAWAVAITAGDDNAASGLYERARAAYCELRAAGAEIAKLPNAGCTP